jgi:hypothetical protein
MNRLRRPNFVGQSTEEECPDHFAQQGDGAHGEGHLGRGQVESLLLADQAFGAAGDGDLEAVEHPGHAQSHDQAGVESGPTQAIEPGRNEAPDGSSGRAFPIGPVGRAPD